MYRRGYLSHLPKELRELTESYRNACSPWLKVRNISEVQNRAWLGMLDAVQTVKIKLDVIRWMDERLVDYKTYLLISKDSVDDYRRALEKLDQGEMRAIIPKPSRGYFITTILERGGLNGLPGGLIISAMKEWDDTTEVLLYCDDLREAIIIALQMLSEI